MLLGRTFTTRPIHPFFEFQYTAIAFFHSLLLQLSEEVWHTYFYQMKPQANFSVLHSTSTFLKTDSIKSKPVLNNLGSVRISVWIYDFNIIGILIFFPGRRSYCEKYDGAHMFKILPSSQGGNVCGWTQPHIQTGGGEVLLPEYHTTQGCKFLSRKPERFFANLLLKS